LENWRRVEHSMDFAALPPVEFWDTLFEILNVKSEKVGV
jgi:hypothetical protein